jgi:integrative and conjugative element protein (TIGR02256 family)
MREARTYRRIILSESAARAIRKEAAGYLFKETGGALVGYVDEQFSAVIVSASGPGPRAKRRYSDVQIDGAFTTRFCEAWRSRSGGVIDYLGDWHTHVSSSTSPSGTDLRAMQKMVPFTASLSFPPISLIMARFTSRYEAFVFNNSKLVPVACFEVSDSLIFCERI